MIARAPGKVVLSGAYAVLDGAPACVAAVDRYVVADASRPAPLITDEVRAARGSAPAPWFDAGALREAGKKLGLGSSAAILVASLGALELARRGPLSDQELARAVFEPALDAHRRAQGGGSGIDVAASAHGGTLLARRSGAELALEPCALPEGTEVEVFACAEPASTPELVRRVRALRETDPAAYARLMGAQASAAEAAAEAIRAGARRALIAALDAQRRALAELGAAAGAPIVTIEVAELAERALLENAAFLPAGAGGGDLAVFVGSGPSSEAFRARAGELRLRPLDLGLGARGVHAA